MNLAVPRWLRVVLVLAAFALAAVPAGVYWAAVARQPTVAARDVREQVAAGALVVDVRAATDRRLAGAATIPAEDLLAVPSAEALPAAWRGRTLILVCEAGIRSAQVTAHLRSLGQSALNLEGGMEAWTASGAEAAVPRLSEPAWKQWMVVLTGFVVKPLYMLLALGLAIHLRRAITPGTVGLRRALWAFFAGEAFCALNYLVFAEESQFTDMLHSWGMALAAGFGAWSVAIGAVRHLLPDAEGGRCGLERLCQPCTRGSLCRHERLLPLAALLTIFSALIPLTATCQGLAAATTILGTPYAYRHDWVQVVFELRCCPLAAIGLGLLGLGLALARRHGAALACICAAAGPLAFAFFRLLLGAGWRDDPAWFLAWEEFGELATILAVGWWLTIFRRREA